MKNKKGFIAISLIYSFFLVFLMVMISILAKYVNNRILVNALKNDIKSDMKKEGSFLTITLTNKTYGVGETVNYAGEYWQVIQDDGDSVRLVLNRALKRSEIVDALGTTIAGDQNYVSSCTENACAVRLCRNAVTQPLSNGSYLDQSNTFCFYHSADTIEEKYIAPLWASNASDTSKRQSIISYVTNSWFNSHMGLQKALLNGKLKLMTANDGTYSQDLYIRIPTSDEANNSNTWKNPMNFQVFDYYNATYTRVYYNSTLNVVRTNYSSYIRPVIDAYKDGTSAPVISSSHFKLMNGAHVVQNGTEKYIEFDGADDYVKAPDILSTDDLKDGFTIEFTAMWKELKSWSRIMDFGNGSGSDNILIANEGIDPTITSNLYNGTNSVGARKGNTISLNTKDTYQYSYTRNGNGYTILGKKNGSEIINTTSSFLVNNIKRSSNYLGKSNWLNDSYFYGNIYAFKITLANGKVLMNLEI